MPTYDYKCSLCGAKFEIVSKIAQTPQAPKCRKCRIEMSRVYSSPNVTFKGSGRGKDAN